MSKENSKSTEKKVYAVIKLKDGTELKFTEKFVYEDGRVEYMDETQSITYTQKQIDEATK